jgi:hypothetical protein
MALFRPSASAERARWKEFKKIADRVPKLYRYLEENKLLSEEKTTHPVTGERYKSHYVGLGNPEENILYNHLISRFKADQYRAVFNYPDTEKALKYVNIFRGEMPIRNTVELGKHIAHHEAEMEKGRKEFVKFFAQARPDLVKTREDALRIFEEKIRDRVANIDEMKLFTVKDIAKAIFGKK